MRSKVRKYIRIWKERGYGEGLPDEVPEKLMQLGIAPSYKAICFAILKNDHSMQSLGFTPKKSEWYSKLKKIEIEQRERDAKI